MKCRSIRNKSSVSPQWNSLQSSVPRPKSTPFWPSTSEHTFLRIRTSQSTSSKRSAQVKRSVSCRTVSQSSCRYQSQRHPEPLCPVLQGFGDQRHSREGKRVSWTCPLLSRGERYRPSAKAMDRWYHLHCDEGTVQSMGFWAYQDSQPWYCREKGLDDRSRSRDRSSFQNLSQHQQ